MKKFLAVAVVALLVGCTPISVADVVKATTTMCSFAPTAQSIAALLIADKSILTAIDAALLICKELEVQKQPQVMADGNIRLSVPTSEGRVVEVIGKKVEKERK